MRKKSSEASYRFVNDDGIVVEIITHISKKQQNDTFSEVLNLEIDGTKWLGEHERKEYMPNIEIEKEIELVRNMSKEAIEQFKNEVLSKV